MSLKASISISGPRKKKVAPPKKKASYMDITYVHKSDFENGMNRVSYANVPGDTPEPCLAIYAGQTNTRINKQALCPQDIESCDEIIKAMRRIKKEMIKYGKSKRKPAKRTS